MSTSRTRWSLAAFAALAMGVLALGGCVYHHDHGGGRHHGGGWDHRGHRHHGHHGHGGQHGGHRGHHR